MKTYRYVLGILVSFLLVASIGCKEGSSDSNESAPKESIFKPPTAIGNGNYVLSSAAVPTVYGETYNLNDNNYEYVLWEDGDVFVEIGTFEILQDKYGDNYIRLTPTSFIPEDCGIPLTPYEYSYEWEAYEEIITKFIYFELDKFTQADPSWPYVGEYGKANFTSNCP